MDALAPTQFIGNPPGQQETEWQFDALDLRPVEAWLLSGHGGLDFFIAPGAADEQVDTYFDTPDWRFNRAGYALRVRRRAGRATATLKTLAAAQDGLRQRLEIEEPLEGAGPDAEGLRQARGPVGERVRALAGRQPLGALFDVRTYRRRYAVVVGGAQAAEIALDDTTVPAAGEGDEPFRLRRVEIEVSPGSQDGLQPFVERLKAACGLQSAVLGKFDLGLFAHGLQPAGLPDLGPAVVEAGQTLGATAFATLRRYFADFLAHEPGTRLGDDPEHLHDMRVAGRRQRAAMRLFREALPARFSRLRDELRWIAGALGEVRDLDVQLEQYQVWAAEAGLPDREALKALDALVETQRAAARRRMLRALDSARYERLLAALTAALHRGPTRRAPQAGLPVLRAAPPLITQRYRKTRKMGTHINEASAAEEYHALRIQCKQLRYALEFFREIYGKPAEAMIARLVRLQDILGKHQDASVASQTLRDLSVRHARRLPPQTIFAMGALAQRYAEQAAALRAEFPEAFREFEGRPWRRLERAMEERLAELPARTPRRARPKSPSPAE
jgi:CHAD domain-containing protein